MQNAAMECRCGGFRAIVDFEFLQNIFDVEFCGVSMHPNTLPISALLNS
jgi:hypothetical protein